MEVAVSPGIHFAGAVQISAFSYHLTLRYSTKLFLFRKSFSKAWSVELRTFDDGYSWEVRPV